MRFAWYDRKSVFVKECKNEIKNSHQDFRDLVVTLNENRQGTVVLGVSARFVSTNLDEVVGSNLGLGSFLLKQLESQEKRRGLFRKNEACRAVSFERRKAP